MGLFIAKLKRDNSNWYKLKDKIMASYYENIDLHDAMIYNPNNNVANQWFKLKLVEIPELFNQTINPVELNSLNRLQYKEISFIAYYSNKKFYVQNVNKGSYLSKKLFSRNGDLLEYEEKEDIIFINPIPHCIYDENTKEAFFTDISRAYSIFSHLKLKYKEATRTEVERMLKSDIIDAPELNYDKVGVQNRRRISTVLDIYEKYDEDQRKIIKEYIKEFVSDKIDFDDKTEKFKINTDNKLRLILYGLQKRFFKAPLEEDIQVATSVAKLSDMSDNL